MKCDITKADVDSGTPKTELLVGIAKGFQSF